MPCHIWLQVYHPNIDKASWFRMKHRSRVEREDTEEAEKRAMKAENKADGDREKEILKIVDEIKAGGEAAEHARPSGRLVHGSWLGHVFKVDDASGPTLQK